MGRQRSSDKRQLARRGGAGRVIDTTGELPVAPFRPIPSSGGWDGDDGNDRAAPGAAPGETLYAPRPRVTARPLARPLVATLLAEPESEPLAGPRASQPGMTPRRLITRFTVSLTERLRLNTPRRRRALLVYLAVAVIVAQTLVGALTPLGRSERQTFDSALGALGAAAPAYPTPFPSGPTPQPVASPAAFIQTMLPYARKAHNDLGWPTSVILAQMGVEHGWRFPDFDGWNLANSRPFPDPNGDGGVCYGQSVVRNFCYAATPWIGLAIYEHVAHLSYYRGVAAAARTGGAAAAARALGQSPWDAGHYTAGGAPGDTLINAMKRYNLYQYDQ